MGIFMAASAQQTAWHLLVVLIQSSSIRPGRTFDGYSPRTTARGVFNNRPPQSIAELGEIRYKILKPSLHIGFDL